MSPRVKKAKEIALRAHAGQMYGRCPYEVHLEKVQEILREFGYDSQSSPTDSFAESVCAAGWIHDVLEDTDFSWDVVRQELGEQVFDIAWRVTDEPGDSRETRKQKTYPKIRGHHGATIVKLADRIANLESSLEARNHHLDTYLRESSGFRGSLFVQGIAEALWQRYDDLISRAMKDGGQGGI